MSRRTTGASTTRGTSTSRFGVGRRESHDATDFYARFSAPELSDDDEIAPPVELAEPLVHGDARHMDAIADRSVALVVTSPPYFAGKAYEEALGVGGIPADYLSYLELLRDVFAECKRTLEPGGRIAVNVANLGRKPYRSLASDVIRILQDDLGLLLRGEIIWLKAEGASGSCAWGSFRSAANPVLRDVSERVVVASKGRFDRARRPEARGGAGLPHRSAISTDEFMEATLDVWRIPPERARRVGHPAPFPVELPLRLIDLYTFEGDLVLDPFLGAGSTAVAAVRRGRRFAGYDTDASYIGIARSRVDAALAGRDPKEATRELVIDEGKGTLALAVDELEAAGFVVRHRNWKVPGAGVSVGVVADDADGRPWHFDVTGGFTVTRNGLARADVLWRCLGRASVLATSGVAPIVLLTSDLPPRRSSTDQAVRALGPRAIHDVVELLAPAGRQRLATYAAGGRRDRPLPGWWTPAETDAGQTQLDL